MVKRFSRKMLFEIEDRNIKGYSISKIAKDLKITKKDVQEGLNKIYKEEIEK